ncbi:hypothetical protein PIB30_086616, partial [Stylosanthes scabra]|nr:hypothetical protein [Stylosanthes scabra]
VKSEADLTKMEVMKALINADDIGESHSWTIPPPSPLSSSRKSVAKFDDGRFRQSRRATAFFFFLENATIVAAIILQQVSRKVQ